MSQRYRQHEHGDAEIAPAGAVAALPPRLGARGEAWVFIGRSFGCRAKKTNSRSLAALGMTTRGARDDSESRAR